MVSKVAVSMPEELLKKVKKEVHSGRAKSVSAVVVRALAGQLENDELGRVLAEMDVKYGPPGKEAEAWAKKVLDRAGALTRRP
jgi:Arc/MetJ-type ribon-helix-helix transcriptional regulator